MQLYFIWATLPATADTLIVLIIITLLPGGTAVWILQKTIGLFVPPEILYFIMYIWRKVIKNSFGVQNSPRADRFTFFVGRGGYGFFPRDNIFFRTTLNTTQRQFSHFEFKKIFLAWSGIFQTYRLTLGQTIFYPLKTANLFSGIFCNNFAFVLNSGTNSISEKNRPPQMVRVHSEILHDTNMGDITIINH